MSRMKRIVGVVFGLVVVALLAAAFLPEGVDVEIGRAVQGPLKVTVSGTGKARVKERYAVSASVTGWLQRIRFEAGDVVAAGDVLAQIAPAPLDERTEAELRGRLSAARGAEAEARSALERARLAEKRAESDWKRTQLLTEGETISAQQYEAAKIDWQARTEEVKMAGAALRRARGEAEATRALLSGAGPGGKGAEPGEWAVRAPSAGHILKVFQESEGIVSAGTPLIEIGDLKTLEVSVDLLTTQAVRVRPGARVELTQWGGDRVLPGRVKRVEPSAFTKVSALGIEEQRVNVIVEPEGGPEAWSALGDGYRVDAGIVVDERSNALKIALGCLFRRGDDWAVFIVADGRVKTKTIRLGESDGSEVEVKGGLSEGDSVVLHPSDKLSDGTRVKSGG